MLAMLAAAACPLRAESDVRSVVLALVGRASMDRPAVRDKALDELADLGASGLETLRGMMQGRPGTTPAQRRAAARVFNLLTCMDPPARREEVRHAGRTAFEAADFETMARRYARLAVLSDASVDDCLWNGHARQLAGRWASAVTAYQLALARIDELLSNPPPRPARVGRVGKGVGPVPVEGTAPGWSAREKQSLLEQRVLLILRIGCLQRDECGDADAAAATFAAAADHIPLLNRPTEQVVADYAARLRDTLAGRRPPIVRVSYYALQAMSEVAACKEKMRQFADALSAWDRAYSAAMLCRGSGDLKAVAAMARLVQKLRPDEPVPPLHWLVPLTPAAPAATLKMTDPNSLARSCKPSSNPKTPHHNFAFVPPAGKEFARVRVVCDLEQLRVRYGGPLACSACVGGESVHLGSFRWRKKKPGREKLERTFDVPAGAEMLRVTGGSWHGNFIVHEVTAAATFRPRAKAVPAAKRPASARPQAWIQQELLPRGGKATRNGKAISSNDIACTLKPGRYTFTYEHPDRRRRFRAALDLRPGERYGLCVNLDSPFRAAMTNLGPMGYMPPAYANLAKLPDGRWMVAYCRDFKIMLATSKDLLRWDGPWPLPLNSIFRNSAPSLLVAADGTIHLAYFSKRLDLNTESSAGFRLWLTRSADGKRWSPPRPVFGLGEAQYQNAPAQMLRAADGRVWVFWSKFAARAADPAGIRRLEPLEIALPPRTSMSETRAYVEPGGRMHLAFTSGRSIYYSSSADGRRWRDPVELLTLEQHGGGSHPQVICRGGDIALLYETNKGAWLRTGRLGGRPQLGEPIKITNHVRPLDGARAHVTPRGEVLLLTGRTAPWLLQTTLKELLPGPAPAEGPSRGLRGGI